MEKITKIEEMQEEPSDFLTFQNISGNKISNRYEGMEKKDD